MNSQHPISYMLKRHYSQKYLKYGNCSKGVDWGENVENSISRHYAMLDVITDSRNGCSLLDVGCGYGALLETINHDKKFSKVKYAGIDIVSEMIDSAKSKYKNAKWTHADYINTSTTTRFDYIVSNGILTQKASASNLEMNQYAQLLITKMFMQCKIGIAFNIMSTFVNFQKDNLYYRNPSELIAWCMSTLTPHLKVNAHYDPWYEYTLYLYKGVNSLREH